MSAYEARCVDSRFGRFGRDLIRVSDGVEIANDYGEPEDKSFGRDLAPVVDELNALAARLVAAESRASAAEREAERMRKALMDVAVRSYLPVVPRVNGFPAHGGALAECIKECVTLAIRHVSEPARAALAAKGEG